MRSTTPTRTWGPLLVAALGASGSLAIAPTARADKVDKQALAVFEDGATATLKDLKKRLKLQRKVLDAELSAIESDAEGGAATLAWLADVFDHVNDSQVNVRDALATCAGDMRTVHGEAMTVLVDAGRDPDADAPKGMLRGEGGPFDEVERDIEAAVVKHCALVEARVQKTAKVLRKRAKIHLAARVRPPDALTLWLAFPSGGGTAYVSHPLTLDTVIAGSWLEVPGSGSIRVGGSTHSFAQSVQIYISTGAEAVVSADLQSRWSHTFNGFEPGGVAISAFYVGMSGSAIQAIGMR